MIRCLHWMAKENGLYFYEKITEQAGRYLEPGGWLMYEIGCDQGMDVSEIMKKMVLNR